MNILIFFIGVIVGILLRTVIRQILHMRDTLREANRIIDENNERIAKEKKRPDISVE